MATIDLKCLVSGDSSDETFTVEIALNKNVSILKRMIKENTGANDIQLFKVSLPLNEVYKAGRPLSIGGAYELSSPLDKISDHFLDPPRHHVHVIALAPTGSGNRRGLPSLSDLLELHKDLEAGWTQEYQGSTHRVLLDNILSDPRASPYCNTGAIVQSSGYGKSRTVDELAKLVFTIPMNVRAEDETLQGAYPLPDTHIARLIRSMAYFSDDEIVMMFHILFCALFNRIVAELDTIHLGSHIQAEQFATQWREHLLRDGNRFKLYSSVIDDVQPQFFRMELSSSAKSDAEAALKKLISRIPVVGEEAGTPLSVVMYIDEAHELEVKTHTRRSTLYDLLTRAVSSYNEGFFVLFLSTVPRMRQLTPNLLPPYTEMPFDCHPSLSPLSPEELTLEDVQDFGFISRFGRPLFWSMLEPAQRRSPENPPYWKMKAFALQKLTCSSSISDLEPQARLAILDTILNLKYHLSRAKTAALVEDMVASHMRTAFYAPKHLEYLYTGYPSEPVLAEAAMEALDRTESAGRRVVDAATEFFSSLDAGPTRDAIDMGQRGENVAKMILVRAYMSAVRTDYVGSFSGPNWSSGCSLVTFLKSLTGRDFRELVLDCKPNNLLPSEGLPLKDAFARSWVRFTHFVRAADDAAVTTSAACVAFVRAMSFIGCSSPKSVDICIPILLDSDKPIIEANMSAILVQIKLRSKKGSYEIDAKQIGLFPPPGSSRDYTKMVEMDVRELEKYFRRPYISLVMELGVGTLRDAQPAHVQAHLDRASVPSPPGIGVVAHGPPTEITSRATSKANVPRIYPRYSLCFYGCTPEAGENEVKEDAAMEEEEEGRDTVLEKVQEDVPTRAEDEKQNLGMVLD